MPIVLPTLNSEEAYLSKTTSEIWSHTLSGWPSVTDSDVNKSDP